MELLPCHIIRINLYTRLLRQISRLCLISIRVSGESAFLATLISRDLLLEDVDEVFVQATFEQAHQDYAKCYDDAKGEEYGTHMDVLIANLQIVIHARGPLVRGNLLGRDLISESELAFIYALVELLVEIEGWLSFVTLADCLAWRETPWLNLKSDDALVIAVLDRRRLH